MNAMPLPTDCRTAVRITFAPAPRGDRLALTHFPMPLPEPE